jgi:hypothetical protein
MSTRASRPIGVAVISIVIMIQAVLAIMAGLGLFLERNDESLLSHLDQSSDTVGTYGILAIVWGVVALLVALGLWGGAGWARFLVAIVELLQVVGGVWLLFGWDGHYRTQGVGQIIAAVIVLWLLFNPRADEFFEGRRAA